MREEATQEHGLVFLIQSIAPKTNQQAALAENAAGQELLLPGKSEPLSSGEGTAFIECLTTNNPLAPGAFEVEQEALIHDFSIGKIAPQPVFLTFQGFEISGAIAVADVNVVSVDAILDQRAAYVNQLANENGSKGQGIVFVNDLIWKVAKGPEELAGKGMGAAKDERLKCFQIRERVGFLLYRATRGNFSAFGLKEFSDPIAVFIDLDVIGKDRSGLSARLFPGFESCLGAIGQRYVIARSADDQLPARYLDNAVDVTAN